MSKGHDDQLPVLEILKANLFVRGLPVTSIEAFYTENWDEDVCLVWRVFPHLVEGCPNPEKISKVMKRAVYRVFSFLMIIQ